MARPLRIEFPNAIYHVMARGNGRQAISHIDDDYQQMTDGLAKTVSRTGWQVLAYVWIPNHIHHFVRTPKPNLSRGMQYLLDHFGGCLPTVTQRDRTSMSCDRFILNKLIVASPTSVMSNNNNSADRPIEVIKPAIAMRMKQAAGI